MKNTRRTLLLTTLLLLLPVAAGLLLWNRLPEQVPTHFNFRGEANGWSSRGFAVFGLPLLMLVFQLVAVLAVRRDPRKENISPRLAALVLWIVPVVTLAVMFAVYAAALGMAVDVLRVTALLTGLLFTVLGNYLPKCAPNSTVGIRVPWTMASGEVWQKTHRMAGGLMVLCGIAMLLTAFLGGPAVSAVLLGTILLSSLAPLGYAFLLSRR